MKVILDKKIYNEIWDKIYKDFKFTPNTDTSIKTFEFPMHNEQFNLKSFWNEEQEKIVNTIFKELSDDDIYALEWQSDCFEFNPNENIEYEYHYHDDERNVEVYFPTYYPDGDYYFFIAKDFSYGMFTHPWKKQIYIWGEKLINKINQNVDILNLEKINNNTSTPKFKTIKEIYNLKPDNVNEISPLSKWYNELIDKTIDEITENDVEIMIRQNILLELALKKAIDILNIDVFAGPKCTAGILIHVSKLDISYLKKYSKELKNISLNALNKSKKWKFIDDEEKKEIQEAIKTILEKISTNKLSNNKSNDLIIGFSILLSIALIILAITLTTTKHGWFQGISIIGVAFIAYILYSQISIKQQYKIRFFFDYCSFTCLWSGDELTGKKYGYPITKFKKLGLSNSTIKEIEKLSNLFDMSLNWADPGYGDSPWDKQQWKEFDEQAQRLFERISKELPKNFKLVNEHKPYVK